MEGAVVLVGRARRARRDAETIVGGLSETALPYPRESPLTKGDSRRASPKPIISHLIVNNALCSVQKDIQIVAAAVLQG